MTVSEIEAVGKAFGARPDGKKGWFQLDPSEVEAMLDPSNSPRSIGSTSPKSGSSIAGGPAALPNLGGSGIFGQLSSASRNQGSKPAARKISSFLWKTREERQNEILGGGK